MILIRSTARISGFSLAELLVVVGILGILAAITIPAIHRTRDAAYRIQCTNHLKQIGTALQQYHDELRGLPPGCSYHGGKDPFPHLGWGTRVLPYLEFGNVWLKAQEAYRQDKFFGNRPPHVGDKVIPTFLCPNDGRSVFGNDHSRMRAGFSCYLGVEGTNQIKRDGLLYLDSNSRFSEVSDGISQTILVGERPPSANGHYGWWYAGWGQDKDGSAEMILGAREIPVAQAFRDCPPGSSSFRQGGRSNQCDALHFWSHHFGGAHFLMCDGSVHFLSYSADSILPALATRAGNEAVELP